MDTNKKTFYVTFGQKSPFRDGWAEILGTDYGAAHDHAKYVFGQDGFAGLYSEDQWDQLTRDMFPQGRFGYVVEAL